MFDKNMHNRQQKTSAGESSTAKKASPVAMMNGMDDLSFIFGGILCCCNIEMDYV